ncbi:MAG: hypothetical protein FWD59_10515 [Micrococcales bacterium]|nr:hypothetical protein [Micrococcales bacterium]
MTDVLAATRARIGEVLALRWCDIGLGGIERKPSVTLWGTLTWVTGLGLIRQDHPKTASEWRTITRPAFVAKLLCRYRAERQPDMKDPMFPSVFGSFRSANNCRGQWRDAIAGTKAQRAPDVSDALEQLARPPTPPPLISM